MAAVNLAAIGQTAAVIPKRTPKRSKPLVLTRTFMSLRTLRTSGNRGGAAFMNSLRSHSGIEMKFKYENFDKSPGCCGDFNRGSGSGRNRLYNFSLIFKPTAK